MIYHFDIHDGQEYLDTLGTDCSSLEMARIEAVERIGKLLMEDAARFWTGDEWKMAVTDSAGVTLFTLSFTAKNAPPSS